MRWIRLTDGRGHSTDASTDGCPTPDSSYRSPRLECTVLGSPFFVHVLDSACRPCTHKALRPTVVGEAPAAVSGLADAVRWRSRVR